MVSHLSYNIGGLFFYINIIHRIINNCSKCEMYPRQYAIEEINIYKGKLIQNTEIYHMTSRLGVI